MISGRALARGASELRQSLASLVGTVEFSQAAALLPGSYPGGPGCGETRGAGGRCARAPGRGPARTPIVLGLADGAAAGPDIGWGDHRCWGVAGRADVERDRVSGVSGPGLVWGGADDHAGCRARACPRPARAGVSGRGGAWSRVARPGRHRPCVAGGLTRPTPCRLVTGPRRVTGQPDGRRATGRTGYQRYLMSPRPTVCRVSVISSRTPRYRCSPCCRWS